MKYTLTTGKVQASTSIFAEQRDNTREMRQSEAATLQRTAVGQKKKKIMGTFRRKKKYFFYESENL